MTKRMLWFGFGVGLCGLLLGAGAHQSAATTSGPGLPPRHALFESGPVRPLALSPDGSRLYALNTPDARLEIFRVEDEGLRFERSLSVGLEPVALAVRSESELWVVNHLSDSVSVIQLEPEPHVSRTLLVGDEPRDIVFAGPNNSRAFITTAHRGQHRTHPSLADVLGAGEPQLMTPSIPRADVWVFDAEDLGPGLGGRPLKIVELFGDTPRALAVNTDGATVYAAVFHSGNRTTVVPEGAICDGFGTEPCELDGVVSPAGIADGLIPGGLPGPAENLFGSPAPETGLIVKFNEASGQWQDEAERNFSNGVRFNLPDYDVFAIAADSLEQTRRVSGVGTVNFNMVVNPATGDLYVSNTEANNLARFEGEGRFAGSTVRGNLHQARISVIDEEGALPIHLNSHIDYSISPSDEETPGHSLATPLDMVVSEDGETLYVAAFGSSKVGVIETVQLKSGNFDPIAASENYLDVSGGGPGGLALDEARNRLYVLTRFDNAVSVLDLESGAELQHLAMFNPEPPAVIGGRAMLYDATSTSSNGEASCASCHVFGDMDGLAWDLGDPDAQLGQSQIPIKFEEGSNRFFPQLNGSGNPRDFHPMKGPMTTQTLRGLRHSGALHWRGDRSTGVFGTDPFDANLSFLNFASAFRALLGSDVTPGRDAMQDFADFALEIQMPPNPVRALANSLTRSQQEGRDFFFGPHPSDGGRNGFTCDGCHQLDGEQGFFGTNGEQSFEGETQVIKIPQLRNLYQKVGMFGMPRTALFLPVDNRHQDDQVRGFGYLHDGSIDTLFNFFRFIVFSDVGSSGFFGGDEQRRAVSEFMLAFDSDLAPIVGQQITLTSDNEEFVLARIKLFEQRASTPFVSRALGGRTLECELIAKAVHDRREQGWLYEPATRRYISDSTGDEAVSGDELRQWQETGNSPMTFTCAPPGSGRRMALDRNLDGVLNGDETF